MRKQIHVNLAVADLKRSQAFFEDLDGHVWGLMHVGAAPAAAH